MKFSVHTTIEAALDVDRARAGNDVADAVGKYGVRQNRCGAGAVADHLAGFFRRLAEHAGAKIFLRVLEVEFLGDGDAVVAHDRRVPLLLDQHRLRSRPQGHAHRVGELCGAAQDFFTGGGAEQDLLVCHSSYLTGIARLGIERYTGDELMHRIRHALRGADQESGAVP